LSHYSLIHNRPPFLVLDFRIRPLLYQEIHQLEVLGVAAAEFGRQKQDSVAMRINLVHLEFGHLFQSEQFYYQLELLLHSQKVERENRT